MAIFRSLTLPGLLILWGALTDPAAAQMLNTYWKPEPIDIKLVQTPKSGDVFLEQRLIPLKLVRLTQAATLNDRGKELPEGTLLYMVFSDLHDFAYCPPGDRSAASALALLHARPCLLDSNKDGKFEKFFTASQYRYGAPYNRGNPRESKPMSSAVSYVEVDPHEFPIDIRMKFIIHGHEKIERIKASVAFEEAANLDYDEAQAKQSPYGWVIAALNAVVKLDPMTQDGTVPIMLTIDPDRYVHQINDNEFRGINPTYFHRISSTHLEKFILRELGKLPPHPKPQPQLQPRPQP